MPSGAALVEPLRRAAAAPVGRSRIRRATARRRLTFGALSCSARAAPSTARGVLAPAAGRDGRDETARPDAERLSAANSQPGVSTALGGGVRRDQRPRRRARVVLSDRSGGVSLGGRGRGGPALRRGERPFTVVAVIPREFENVPGRTPRPVAPQYTPACPLRRPRVGTPWPSRRCAPGRPAAARAGPVSPAAAPTSLFRSPRCPWGRRARPSPRKDGPAGADRAWRHQLDRSRAEPTSRSCRGPRAADDASRGAGSADAASGARCCGGRL